MNATESYVRICPVCGAEHPAAATQCACGALLAGVDLSLKAAANPAPAVGEETIAYTEAAVPAGVRCPHKDCGAVSPPGARRCLYCGRSLAAGPGSAFLDWPWGERLEISGPLVFGREGSLPETLRQRLAKEFDNVSRRHAELDFSDGQLWITDLGSANGTFINGERLAPRIRHGLKPGMLVRFAADLVGTVRLG